MGPVDRNRRTTRLAAALLSWASLSSAALSSPTALAQAPDGFPSKPVRLVLGFSAGGVADVTGRNLAQRLSERFGQPVVVENRVGAGGNIAAQFVSRATPDGYTLLVGSSSLSSNAALGTKPEVDPAIDLTAVSPLVETPFVLVSSKAKGYRSLGHLFEVASASPGKLNYGSNGVGSLNHLIAALLSQMARVTIVHVPYKGGAQQLTAVLSGEVDFGLVSTTSSLPLLRDDRLVALAVSSDRRSSYLPNTPTFADLNFARAGATNWIALFGPKDLPTPIRDRIEREVRAVLSSPQFTESVQSSGGELMPGGSRELASLVAQEVTKWRSAAASEVRK